MLTFSRLRGRDVRDSLPFHAFSLYPPWVGHVTSATMCSWQLNVRCLCVGGKFAFTFAFYFLDVDILIRPEGAQKYVSGRSSVLFFFVIQYLFKSRALHL